MNLLVFGVETAVTTLTCLVEMLSWQGYTNEELGRLCSLYVPYLVVGMASISLNPFSSYCTDHQSSTGHDPGCFPPAEEKSDREGKAKLSLRRSAQESFAGTRFGCVRQLLNLQVGRRGRLREIQQTNVPGKSTLTALHKDMQIGAPTVRTARTGDEITATEQGDVLQSGTAAQTRSANAGGRASTSGSHIELAFHRSQCPLH